MTKKGAKSEQDYESSYYFCNIMKIAKKKLFY